jgi:hypothetical protein
MRLLRNTIYAKAGRTFKDPTLRAYFEAKPWYRPGPEGAVKLSAVDDCGSEDVRRYQLKNGKLVQIGRASRKKGD